MSFKFCPGCREVCPESAWHRNRTTSDGLAAYCKACRREQSKRAHLRRTFNLTTAQRQALLDGQDGLCAICGGSQPGHMDHDHDTGRVRGILCARCNMGLGQFRDDPALLQRAVRYLTRHTPACERPVPGISVEEYSPAEVVFLDYLETHRAG